MEQAVLMHGDVVDLTPDCHPDKPARLDDLGSSSLTRFQTLGGLSDLERAISTFGHAVNLTPNGHSDKPCYLANLGAVCQPPSDGLSPLPGVETELRHIQVVTRDLKRTTLLESSTGMVEDVLELMKNADWVHFACHGIQDTRNPADGGLCLANERRLTISDIIALSRPRGGLAFLSACQTAMGDEKLSDDAIHIAAAMLFAGYGGVISVIYEQLFQYSRKPDYQEAAQALQDTTGRPRDGGVSFAEWLPFM